MLKTDTLEDVCSFAPTTDAILDIKISLSGLFFACYDAAHRVLIFKKYGYPAIYTYIHASLVLSSIQIDV